MYITRDDWDPLQPLAWSDLEAFWSVTNPPQSGSAGSEGGHYYWDVRLPEGKSGRHMIFIQWVRSDSPENFFSCSDVVFDGGDGEVTGVGPRLRRQHRHDQTAVVRRRHRRSPLVRLRLGQH